MKRRQVEPELMDDPALDAARHRAALRGLGRLNVLSRSAAAVDRVIVDLAGRDEGHRPPRRLSVLDIATGGGDVPIALWRRARRRGASWRVGGCDLSPIAIEHARERADRAGADIEFFQLNALRDPIPGRYDVVTCCLFLHHLADRQAAELLRRMADAATLGIVVNDLERSRLSLALAATAARLVTRSRIVHVDAARSVRAAFRADEMRNLAETAGLNDARVQRRPPCRLLLTWRRP